MPKSNDKAAPARANANAAETNAAPDKAAETKAAETNAAETNAANAPAETKAAENPLAGILADIPKADAPAPAPEKRQTARVIKPETVAVFLLLAQRTKAAPTYRANMTKATRRRARRLVAEGLVVAEKNGNGNSYFYLNPTANPTRVKEYVDFAKANNVRPAREVPGAGAAEKD